MEIEIKGRKIELNGTLPLKLKDWKYLEKKGVNITKINDAPIDNQVKILLYVLNQVDSTITQDDIESLSLNDPAVQAIIANVNSAESVNRPTVTLSTS